MMDATGFQSLPPTPPQRASHHTAPKDDSAFEFSWAPDLGFLPRVAPIELTTEWRSTNSSLVFLPMNPLDIPVWNEEREVKVPQLEASYG